ncbi:hypothetical protein ACFVYF_25980 [Streptomyces sp. NPDC058274]|uniref:hypothetical protein n=1 Tax=Streptomyces sp. NPDC058274 TaxID=3346416 RepID=UPI0036E1135E
MSTDDTREPAEPGSAARESAVRESAPEEPRYEPAPSVGRLMLVLLVFVVAAVVVVAGGVYFT